MKKFFTVFLSLVFLLGFYSFAVVRAEERDMLEDLEIVAVYDIPNPKFYNDIVGNYNLLGTLRMTFPDICFVQNQKAIEDVLTGKKDNFLIENTEQELRYNYAVKLYLLEPQLMVYCNELYKLGIINPYLDTAIQSIIEQPTTGKVNLIKIFQQHYTNMGILKPLAF